MQRYHSSSNKKTSWVLGDLDRSLPFCSSDKNIKLSKGDLLSTSVLCLNRSARWKVLCVLLQQLFLGAMWTEPPDLSSSVFSAICSEAKIPKL